MKSVFKENLENCISVLENSSHLDSKIEEAIQCCVETVKNGGKILICGNGGSAAECQHFAAELTGRFITDRRPLPALALTTDTSAITCISNDYSFLEVFSRPITALGKQGDCLFAISTSGNSENVMEAIRAAKVIGIKTIGLLGKDGGAIKDLCDVSIIVGSNSTARIQEIHLLIIHSICGGIEICLEIG